jgi:pyruvate dehydrogenase E1 component
MYLNRGGHDPYKVYAAYARAAGQFERPTVILAMTVKGYGMGEAGEASNETHSLKKLDVDALKAFRDRFAIPIERQGPAEVPYYKPDENSPEMRYMREQRRELGGFIPVRRSEAQVLPVPGLDAFSAQTKGSGERSASTTMAFVRMLSTLAKDKAIGQRVVPIVPDEARTFGMEGMFRQLGIYSSVGQRYTPHDPTRSCSTRRTSRARSSRRASTRPARSRPGWRRRRPTAPATTPWCRSTSSTPCSVPAYRRPRLGRRRQPGPRLPDRRHLRAHDAERRGPAAPGRAQHLLASTIPNCVSYDPTYAYELAVIIQDGCGACTRSARTASTTSPP